MKYEVMNIPCDICGEDYLPHMLNTNSFGSQLSCEACDAQLEKDFEQEKWNKSDLRCRAVKESGGLTREGTRGCNGCSTS
jgi:hypothetical protein